MNRGKRLTLLFLLVFCLVFPGCADENTSEKDSAPEEQAVVSEEESAAPKVDEVIQITEQAEAFKQAEPLDLSDIPEYSGSPYIPVNDNVPAFTQEELTADSFETYSELDESGRCGAAYAAIGVDLMPTEKRGSIGKVKPSGWHSVEYDIVEGDSLYNRCHLIGYQLTAENANEKNLITGTRYLNTEGMLPFENMVADYIKETENHVLYRVTPFFEGDNLVADGVQMEAMSVEDKGEGILFNVYCYNVQPGISIDYATGESRLDGSAGGEEADEQEQDEEEADGQEQDEEEAGGQDEDEADEQDEEEAGGSNEEEQNAESGTVYILNTNTHKFHKPSCSSVKQMKESNTEEYTGNRDDLDSMGYEACKRCRP